MKIKKTDLVVKKSLIPNSGKGLFTKIFIPKGTRIVPYKGKITNWKDVDHKEGTNGYIYYVKRYHVLDALPTPQYLGRYANDASGIGRMKGLKNNSAYVEDGLKVFIESQKDIPAGSEILVSYGKEYWDTIRHNLRIESKDAQKKKGKGQRAKSKGQSLDHKLKLPSQFVMAGLLRTINN